MQVACICHIEIELCMREKKNRKKENKEEIKTKSKFFDSLFMTVRRINEILGVYFTLE